MNKSIVKTQTFALAAPDAKSFLLAGDFTHWQQQALAMKRDKRGVWKASVPLPSGTHHYRFLVNGEWRYDPECPVRAPNSFGSENMVREVN